MLRHYSRTIDRSEQTSETAAAAEVEEAKTMVPCADDSDFQRHKKGVVGSAVVVDGGVETCYPPEMA